MFPGAIIFSIWKHFSRARLHVPEPPGHPLSPRVPHTASCCQRAAVPLSGGRGRAGVAGAAEPSPAEVTPSGLSSARAVTCRLSPAPAATRVQQQHLLVPTVYGKTLWFSFYSN